MPTGIHYDLTHSSATPLADGPKVYAFDADSQSTNYKQQFVQNASDWTPLAWGTEGDTGYYLVDESQPENIDAGMVRWTRTYSQVPQAHTEFEAVAYNYNTIYVWDPNVPPAGNWILFSQVVSFTTMITSKVNYTYYRTDDPGNDITIDLAWKIFQLANNYFFQGTDPYADLDNVPPFYLGDDSSVTRWRGNIWRKANRMVPVPVLEWSIFA
jgi:hypothetical protein